MIHYREEIREIANHAADDLKSMKSLVNLIEKKSTLIRNRKGVLMDNSKSDAVKTRAFNDMRNIDSILNLMRDFDTLSEFLEFIYLEPEAEAENKDSIQLMTMHNSKGLEFNTVFIPSFNEGILPLNRANEEQAIMEEERRIGYVAITRAKRNLYVSFVSKMFGKRTEPSRFLKEAHLI